MPRISNYQAFPITPGTFVGVASNLDMKAMKIVHVQAACTLTFTWSNGKPDTVVTAMAGQDFAIADGCLTLTSTDEVLVDA